MGMVNRNFIYLAFILMACLLITSCNTQQEVMMVDGYKVELKEFSLIINDKRAEAYNYFSKKYGVSDSEKFWETEYEGMSPGQYVKELSLKELTKIKCSQALMIEYGVLQNADYSHFLKRLKEENKSREEAVKEGRAIYGPKQYGEREYYIYLMSNNEIDIKKAINFNITDDELKEYYLQHKEGNYKKDDYIKLNVNGKELILEPEQERVNSQEHPEIYAAAVNMEQGDTKELKTGNGETVLIQCIEKKPTAYISFEEAKSHLIQTLTEERYNEILKKRTENAEVIINKKLYDAFKVK